MRSNGPWFVLGVLLIALCVLALAYLLTLWLGTGSAR